MKLEGQFCFDGRSGSPLIGFSLLILPNILVSLKLLFFYFFSVLDESESKYNSLDEESSTSETARPTLQGDRPADREKDSDNSSTFSVESLDEDGE